MKKENLERMIVRPFQVELNGGNQHVAIDHTKAPLALVKRQK